VMVPRENETIRLLSNWMATRFYDKMSPSNLTLESAKHMFEL